MTLFAHDEDNPANGKGKASGGAASTIGKSTGTSGSTASHAGENPADFVPWVEKYRPHTLSDVIGHAAIVERLQTYARTQNLPHLLLAGPPGSGKTTCVLALARELYGDTLDQNYLELNASDERGIDVMRSREQQSAEGKRKSTSSVKDFARTKSMGGVPFKLIFLDEADALTSDAQQALRRTMETYSSNTRFILGCNYSSKVIEPIQSRCAVFRFTRLKDEDLKRIIETIAKTEGLHVDSKAVDAVIYVAGGDARKAINTLQGAAGEKKKVTEDDVFNVASRARPQEVEKMVKLALGGKLTESRAMLEDLMLKYGLSGQDILAQIYRECVKLDTVPDVLKVNLIDKVGEYDYRIAEGANERIQLEALLGQILLLGHKEKATP